MFNEIKENSLKLYKSFISEIKENHSIFIESLLLIDTNIKL